MNDRSGADERCRLCGGERSPRPDEAPSEGFCSTGCRDVAAALGSDSAIEATAAGVDGRSTDAGEGGRDGGTGNGGEDGGTGSDGDLADVERTHFRVDGMHSTACERFLELVAEGREGVVDAAASYVTESVRVDHDPGLSPETLRDALSTVGYTAYRRDEAGDGSDDRGGDDPGGAGSPTNGAELTPTNGADENTTRRAREMRGLRKRRSDDVLAVRFVAGVVFGSFLLVPYVSILYPTYLAAFVDWGFLSLYAGAFETLDEWLFLGVFAVLTGVVVFLTGMPLLRGAYVALKLRRPNAQLLAALTVLAAVGYGVLAVVAGRNDVYYDLAILVSAIVMAGAYYEASVKREAATRLTDLTISQVDAASRLRSDGRTERVPVGDLDAGERVLVRQGDRVPVDGRLVETACTVDESVVTGESVPRAKSGGDPVVGGSVVLEGAAVVAVGERTTSSVDRLTQTVWDLQSADHGASRRADALATWLTPVVVATAVAVGAGALLAGASPLAISLAALLAVLVASPWALSLATSLSVATCVRDALDRGIVVFDESLFERLRAVDVVVFDKTGTLTTGEMRVRDAEAPPDLLRAAAAVERRASHPVAAAIVTAFGADGCDGSDSPVRSDGGEPVAAPTVEAFESHPRGVEGVVDGRRVLVGHPECFAARGWSVGDGLAERIADARGDGQLPVLVGREGAAEGVIVVGDEPLPGWADAVAALDLRGLEVVVLTGDDERATHFLRDHPAVTHVFAGVPPAGKTAAIRRLRDCGGAGTGDGDGANRTVAMVGDGTNDAPALAAADLGIALGSGTALAADAADLATVDEDLAAVERAFALSRAARRRVDRNLALAFSFNAVAIPAALLGVLSPLVTTVGVCLAVGLIAGNSLRPVLDDV